MDGLSHFEKEIRPWGNFERFTLNEQTTVKIITVEPQQAFSLQTHAHRGEFWRVLRGSGRITVADTIYDAKEGDQFFIPQGAKHRAECEVESLQFLEIAFGQFDENDITRLEDRYGRAR